jgi:Peptidase family C25/Kelch motif
MNLWNIFARRYRVKHVMIAMSLILLISIPVARANPENLIHLTFDAEPVVDNGRIQMQGVESRLDAAGGADLPMISQMYRFPPGTQINGLDILDLQWAETSLETPLKTIPAKPTVNGGSPGSQSIKNRLCGGLFYPDRWVELEIKHGLDPVDLQPSIYAVVRMYPVRVRQVRMQYLTKVTLQLDVEPGAHDSGRSDAALLILSTQEFLDQCGSYITHKQSEGLSVISRSVEDIDANETGRDIQEKIKVAIHRAYNESNIRYVLLAGDADVIPVRYTFHTDYSGSDDWQNIPADLYYADILDGTGQFCDWDASGNDIFGEYADGNIDQCDFLPDVLVGRFPASTLNELLILIDKTIHYERDTQGTEPWLEKIVLAAADTFTFEEHGETSGVPEGEATKELISEESLSGYQLTKLYETDRYPHTAELTTENLKAAIETGALYVNFANHGWVQGWAFDGGFDTADASGLQNYDRLTIAFGYACSTGVFDTENPESTGFGLDHCLAEAFMLNPDGGTVGYYGASRTAFAGGYGFGGHLGAMGLFDRSVFQAVGNGHENQGSLCLQAFHDMVIGKGLADTADFITTLEFTYFGDPSICAGSTPQTSDITCMFRGMEEVVGDGDGCLEPEETVSLNIDLNNDGCDIHNVSLDVTTSDPTCTLQNDHLVLPDIPRGGHLIITPPVQVTLSDQSETNRTIPLDLTVTHDRAVDQFRLNIYVGESAYIVTDQIWVSVDTNNDGMANPGERVRFAPDLTNIGCAPATGFTSQITISDPWVTGYGIQGDGVIPDIPPGTTHVPQKLFWMELDPLTPHDHDVNCQMSFTDPVTMQNWLFSLPLTVTDLTMPVVDQFRVSPAEPGLGETATITVRARDGRGVAEVQATLHSFDIDTDLVVDLYDDGAHQDGDAGDAIFGGQFILPDIPVFLTADLYASDLDGFDGTVPALGGITNVPFESGHPVLIVCGADNDLYLGLYTQALEDAGIAYDIWSWYRGVPPQSVLDQYISGAVIWFYSHTFPQLVADERDAIDYYLSLGGNLLITEQDIGWYLVESGTSETEQWYRDVLLADYVTDACTIHDITGVPTDPVGDGLVFSLEAGSGAQNQDWPSVIDPIAPAVSCFTYPGYSGPGTGTAGIRAEQNGAKHVYLAFGFEGISTQIHRKEVMQSIMVWFEIEADTAGCPWNQSPGWWIGPEIHDAVTYVSSAFCPMDNRIYLSGGYPPTDSTVYAIDTATHQNESTGADLIAARFYHVTACLEDATGPKIYFVGGINGEQQLCVDVEIFDPVTQTVTTLNTDPLPAGIDGIPGSWACARNKLYIMGVAYNGPPYQSGDTWEFDPMASDGNRWRNMNAPLENARFFGAATASHDVIYLMGGIAQYDEQTVQIFSSVETLDLTSDTPTWTTGTCSPLPEGMCFSGAAAVPDGANVPMAGQIILAGGTNFTGNTAPSYVYDPILNAWASYWPMQIQRMIPSTLPLVPSARGPEIWAVGGHMNTVCANTEILHLGQDPLGSWIGIRTGQEIIPPGCILTTYLDLAGETDSLPVDCYITMEIAGSFYFLTADPFFPNFTADPKPFFANAPLDETFTYSGPLLSIPIPLDMPMIGGTFYAATLYSDSGQLAGGFAWQDFTLGEN